MQSYMNFRIVYRDGSENVEITVRGNPSRAVSYARAVIEDDSEVSRVEVRNIEDWATILTVRIEDDKK